MSKNEAAGPRGVKIDKMTTKNLETKILELMNNSSFKKKAEQVASQMKKEDFREEMYNAEWSKLVTTCAMNNSPE